MRSRCATRIEWQLRLRNPNYLHLDCFVTSLICKLSLTSLSVCLNSRVYCSMCASTRVSIAVCVLKLACLSQYVCLNLCFYCSMGACTFIHIGLQTWQTGYLCWKTLSSKRVDRAVATCISKVPTLCSVRATLKVNIYTVKPLLK